MSAPAFWRVAAVALGLAASPPAWAQAAPAADPDLSRAAILADPATPTGGNPKGDVTIVAFFDYNCPYCMKAEPALEALVKSDPGIRLVYKDWPILGAGSVAAARLALAAQWQDRYRLVHDALMAVPLRKVAADQVRTIAVKAGADAARLDGDLNAHASDIDAVLARTAKQADRMGLPGTPVFLVGPLLIQEPLDLDGFRQAVAQARARAKTP